MVCTARLSYVVALSALAWVLTLSSTTRAESNVDQRAQRQQAADAYDRGVGEFDHGEYAAAAQSFLDADALAPNDDALANAVEAARRAQFKARPPALRDGIHRANPYR